MPAFANAYLIPELIMNPVPEPGEPPKTKVMVHGLPGSKFTRQHAPTDAAFEGSGAKFKFRPDLAGE